MLKLSTLVLVLIIALPAWAAEGFQQPFKKDKGEKIEAPQMQIPVTNFGNHEWTDVSFMPVLGTVINKQEMRVSGQRAFIWQFHQYPSYKGYAFKYAKELVMVDCDKKQITPPFIKVTWTDNNPHETVLNQDIYEGDLFSPWWGEDDNLGTVKTVCKLVKKASAK